jgi:hypothetical protein
MLYLMDVLKTNNCPLKKIGFNYRIILVTDEGGSLKKVVTRIEAEINVRNRQSCFETNFSFFVCTYIAISRVRRNLYLYLFMLVMLPFTRLFGETCD